MPANVAAYLCMLILSGIAAYVYNDRLGYTPLLFLAFLFVLDLLSAVVARHSVKLSPKVKQLCLSRGENSGVSYTIVNRGPFFIAKAHAVLRFSGENLEKPMTCATRFSIPSECESTIHILITPPHIGVFTADIRKIRVFGMLGLCALPVKRPQPHTVRVLPRIGGTSGGSDGTPGADDSRDESFQASAMQITENYDGVREYVPGDPMHKIHWKLTAHSLKYMTRLDEGDESPSLTVVIDLPPRTQKSAKAAGTPRAQGAQNAGRTPAASGMPGSVEPLRIGELLRQIPGLRPNDRAPLRARDSARPQMVDTIVETAFAQAEACIAAGGKVRLVFPDKSGAVIRIVCTHPALTAAAIAVAGAASGAAPVLRGAPRPAGAEIFVTSTPDLSIPLRLAELTAAGGRAQLYFVGQASRPPQGSFFDYIAAHGLDCTFLDARAPAAPPASGRVKPKRFARTKAAAR